MNGHAIEHVVLLMLENRSFDHMLGFLSGKGGLTGKETNPVDPLDPDSRQVLVNNRAGYFSPVSPAHDFISVQTQLYGDPGQAGEPARLNGFVKAATNEAKGNLEIGQHVMDCFDPSMLPALSTLVEHFCLCTAWFSAIPGPTWPNRFFVHAATSDGVIDNDPTHPYEMKTIFESLAEAGKTWSIYFGDIPVSLAFMRLWGSLDHFKGFEKFKEDLANNTLATYSFIEPRYMDFLEWKSSDEHPPHDLKVGEYLIAEVYDLLRASSYWEKSLLVILFDEHGGFYDHVGPPAGVPNPDGKVSTSPAFDFTKLGLRVPAVLVSPFIEKGLVDNTIYEHSSVPATIKKLFNLPAYLTARDKAANTFEGNLTLRTPRTDTPLTLPVPGDPQEAKNHRLLFQKRPKVEELVETIERQRISREPLSEFQGSLVELANQLDINLPGAVQPAGARRGMPQIEHEAAVHVEHILGKLIKR